MGKADNDVAAANSRFERFLYADYKGISCIRYDRPSAAVFEDSRPEDKRPSDIYFCFAFPLGPESMEEALESGKARGCEFPQIRLAQAELAKAQRWHKVTKVFNEMKYGMGEALPTILGGAAICLIAVGVGKIFNVLCDSTTESYLNAAVPLEGKPGLTYGSANRTYFQTTESPRQLLSATFDEKGGLKKVCSIDERQPEDGTLAWWVVPKYELNCISGAELSRLSKFSASLSSLPRPQ